MSWRELWRRATGSEVLLQPEPGEDGQAQRLGGIVVQHLVDVDAQGGDGVGVALALEELVLGVEAHESVAGPDLRLAVLLHRPPGRGTEHVEALQALGAPGERTKDAQGGQGSLGRTNVSRVVDRCIGQHHAGEVLGVLPQAGRVGAVPGRQEQQVAVLEPGGVVPLDRAGHGLGLDVSAARTPW